jgi:hypothetical protein
MAPERSKKNTSKANTVFENRMNQKLTYEQTIAGKLEIIPVPDMEAAIWKRIEFQLDIDMPAEGGVDTSQPPGFPKPGPLILGAISIVFLTTLLLYSILINKNHTATKEIPNPTTTPFIVPNQEDSYPPSLEKKSQQSSTYMKPGSTRTTSHVDSNTYALPTVLPPDSNALIKDRGDVIIIPPAASGKDSELIQKKKRGVQGLTDEDYRIAPKEKDELQ